MAEKEGVFKLWLIGYAKSRQFQYDCYGSEKMKEIQTKLQTMFTQICDHADSKVASAQVSWEKGTPGANDVVVYVLFDRDDSIINKKGGQPIHSGASGGTYLQATDMISEVYLKDMDGAADFVKVVSNIIFHEVMHNKLDASKPQSVTDIHTKGGAGLANSTVSASSMLTSENIKIMAGALSKNVKQYTADMKDPSH
ncbi:MAG: hypothetical protein R2681_09630 [Pyrinomonadaceae bacterium]